MNKVRSPWIDYGEGLGSNVSTPRFPEHVRVLTVKRYNREEKIRSGLEAAGVTTAKMVYGIDGDVAQRDGSLQRILDKEGVRISPTFPMNPRQIACTLGHLLLIPRSLPPDAERVLVLEDDATIPSDFVERTDRALHNVPEFDMLYLHCSPQHPHGGCGAEHPGIVSSSGCYHNTAYIISVKFLRACWERERSRLSMNDELFPCTVSSAPFNNTQLASRVTGVRIFCAYPSIVQKHFICDFTTDGDDCMRGGERRGEVVVDESFVSAVSCYDELVENSSRALLRDGLVHIRALFSPGVISQALCVARKECGMQKSEDLLDGRKEYFLGVGDSRWDLLHLAPSDVIRKIVRRMEGVDRNENMDVKNVKPTILTAYPGAGTQEFHRDKGLAAEKPLKLLYAFASPNQIPLEVGATTTLLPGSHITELLNEDDRWQVYLDEGDLLLFFAHTRHRGDANQTDQSRPILSAQIEVMI
jgi:hypothetical protein